MNKALVVVDMLNEFIYGDEDQLLITKEQRETIIPNIRIIIAAVNCANSLII